MVPLSPLLLERGKPEFVEMARKIFVGSLPSAVTEDLLRSEFDRFGRIDEVFIKDMVAL